MSKKDPFWKRIWGLLRSRLPGGAAEYTPSPEKEARLPGGAAEYTPRPVKEARLPEVTIEPLHSTTSRRSAEIPPRVTMKQLWGKDFDLVDEGLSEEQVAEFVNDLIGKCRALEEQQKYFLSLGSYTERAAIDADKAAAAAKARIKSGAEAEAARIIAEANQRSQEMIAEAKKAAQEMTQQEVQNILEAVLRKTAITELQAKQQTQLFLIRSREAIEGDLMDEVKEAYNRILYGLQDLLGKGHQIELEWSEMTDQLRKRDTFELEWNEAGPSALAGEIVKNPSLVAEGYEIGAGVAADREEGEEAK
jgi:cell division septum initiation protein DivIVA